MDEIKETLSKSKTENNYKQILQELQEYCEKELKNINNQKKIEKIINTFNKSKFVKQTELKKFFNNVSIIINNCERANYKVFSHKKIQINNIEFMRIYEGDNEGFGSYECEIFDVDSDNSFTLFEDADYFDDLKNISSIAYDNEDFGQDFLKLYNDQKFKKIKKNEFSEFIQFIFTDVFDAL